jgi:hypothetical protein
MIKKATGVFLAALSLACIAACERDSPLPARDQYPVYASYRDIPGVTAGDIRAVEDLRARGDELVYGMN